MFVLAFCLLFSMSAYATGIEGLQDVEKDISGGTKGSVTWSEAKKELDARMQRNTYPGDDIVTRGWKESSYLIYVCTSHKQKYSVYEHYANILKKDYAELGYADFIVLDKDAYNAKLSATKTADTIFSKRGKVIADTGFNVDKDGFRFTNTAVHDIFDGKTSSLEGLCAGFSWFTLQFYLHGETNYTFNYGRERAVQDFGLDESQYDWTADLSNIPSVKNKKLYSYMPETTQLHSKVSPVSEITDDENTNYRYKSISMKDIKGTKDYDLLRALALSELSIYRLADIGYQKIWDTYQEQEALTEPCPAEELDLIQNEFKKGRPVYIIIASGKADTHAIIGYALAKDVIQPNKYYIKVHDPNMPGGYGYSPVKNKDGYWIEVIVEKKADGKKYLYYDYNTIIGEDAKTIGGNFGRWNNTFAFIDADGCRMHCLKKSDKFGQRAITTIRE